ncbi:MAG: hypothetical protein ACI4UK_07600 [Floccifex sp.]
MKFIYKTIQTKIKEENILYECLNAISILENLKWKDTFQIYVDTLHTFAFGPSEDEKNIKGILKQQGYSFHQSIPAKKALLRRQNHFYALIYEQEPILYGIINPQYLDPFEDYEIYIKDYKTTKNISIKDHINQSNTNYQYYNQNPNGNLAQDCSIRALSHALQMNWHQTLDELSKVAYKMNQLHFNHQDVVEKCLENHHYKK